MNVLKNWGLAALLVLMPLVAFGGPVNINTADAETLAESLDGVGPVKAQAIIEYREQNGDFDSTDDLLEVHGIGAGTVDPLRDQITVSDDS